MEAEGPFRPSKCWGQPLDWHNLKNMAPCWDEEVWAYDAAVGVRAAIYVWRDERMCAEFCRFAGAWGPQYPLEHVTHWMPLRRPPKPEDEGDA